MILLFGKYKGQDTRNVPASYLEWLEGVQSSDLDQLRDAMEARGLRTHRPYSRVSFRNEPKTPQLVELVEAGYRTLAKKLHPDVGGDNLRMQQLNDYMREWRST